ncbi:MAG: ferrochelatase [Ottowia sp.]|nr:ferrochelatase [Ottowia sp.]
MSAVPAPSSWPLAGARGGALALALRSRLGRGLWLWLSTQDVLRELGCGHAARDVFCPCFVADCLETLKGIGMEGKAPFQKAGRSQTRSGEQPIEASHLSYILHTNVLHCRHILPIMNS